VVITTNREVARVEGRFLGSLCLATT